MSQISPGPRHDNHRVLQLRGDLADNGCASMAYSLGVELERRGHHVTYGSGGGVIANRLEAEGHRHELLPGLLYGSRSIGATTAAIRRLSRLYTEMRIDVVHAHNHHSAILAFLAGGFREGGPAVVQTVHGLELRRTYAWRNFPYRWMPFEYIGCSEFTNHWLERLGVPAERRHVILNAVDVGYFNVANTKPRLRQILHIPAGDLLVGAVGRVTEAKNQEALVRSLPLIQKKLGRPVHLIVIGDGPRLNAVRATAASGPLGHQIHLLGFQPQLPHLLVDLDLLVLAANRGEMMPVSLIEGMAMGVPWVAPRLAGIPELAGLSGAGTLFDVGNDSSMIAAIAWILENRHDSRRRRMAMAGLRAANSVLRIERHADAILEVYEKARHCKSGAPGRQ